MDNKDYFKFSQTHDDNIIDFSHPEGFLVVNKDSSEPETELMEANHKLINLITTYQTLKTNDGYDENSLNITVDKIAKILETTNLINYSSFCVYLQVVGYSYSTYSSEKNGMSVSEKRELLKQLIDLYIDNRHNLYNFHGYSDQVLQVNSDAASSRRKGKTGIEKMEDILEPCGFVRAKNMLDLMSRKFCYILPDKGDINLFNRFLRENKINFEFRATRDNKNPDLFLKIKNDYYILEHKLTNGGGGSQNAEINEIIQFINYDEIFDNWHYVSCLQGNFFKKLNSSNNEPKAASQYRNVISNLNNHPKNYFLNGKGFEKFIKDLTKEEDVMKTIMNGLNYYNLRKQNK